MYILTARFWQHPRTNEIRWYINELEKVYVLKDGTVVGEEGEQYTELIFVAWKKEVEKVLDFMVATRIKGEKYDAEWKKSELKRIRNNFKQNNRLENVLF